jgi:3-phenylpropionate/cinnamic acid dioxygenase small subunit
MNAALTLSPEDRFTIIDFIHRYYNLVDTGLAGETAAMFAADAKLTFGAGSPKPGTIHGAEISLAMQSRQQLTDVTTRHSISNIAMSVLGSDKIAANYLMILFRSHGGPRTSLPEFVADVSDIFVREESGWKILERIATPVFSRQEV